MSHHDKKEEIPHKQTAHAIPEDIFEALTALQKKVNKLEEQMEMFLAARKRR